jgi:transcriptional regulator with XRE-family HTH domain
MAKQHDKSTTKKIGARLKERLDARGWTPTELHLRTNGIVTVAAICNYVSGYRRMPVEVAKAFAEALKNTSSAYLMTLDDVPTPPLPPDQSALLDNYLAADERGRRKIRSIADEERLEAVGASPRDGESSLGGRRDV